MTITILSVDLQNDFCTAGGVHYQSRSCVPFITNIVLPFVRKRGHTVVEIISDYRATESETGPSVCVPGQWGYQSLIPLDVKHPRVWVKAEPSPAWVREGAGQASQLPGVPYPAPDAFSAWLTTTVGPPTPHQQIILIGLTLEICVISTLQELHHRGYHVKVLFEGVDTYSGNLEQKRVLFDTLFPFWGQPISWSEIEAASA